MSAEIPSAGLQARFNPDAVERFRGLPPIEELSGNMEGRWKFGGRSFALLLVYGVVVVIMADAMGAMIDGLSDALAGR